MSAIVSSVINSTVGLLCSKLRDYTAERLNEGDLNDEKCRQIIVREIDDIKSKLDGLSRKDLLASLSFFKEGVTRLYASLETSGESCDGPSTSQTSVENESQVEGATAMIPVAQAERDAIQRASELCDLIGNLKIASQERYRSAKDSFKEAKRLATEAFNNVGLSSEDRLMASKFRIASRILECLDDPEAAVRDCLLYLKELHDLPAVQAMFSVWYDSDKGIMSRLRAFFNQKKRNVNVESIKMINALLLDLARKFTNISMGFLQWPTVKISKAFYHSVLLLLYNNAVLEESEESDMQSPWMKKLPTRIWDTALTSKGEILSRSFEGQGRLDITTREGRLDITTRNGGRKLFCTIPQNTMRPPWCLVADELDDSACIRCLAVDENDNVYIVTEFLSAFKYKLLTLDANGNVKAGRSLDIFEAAPAPSGLEMSVAKDGRIVIYGMACHTMFICGSTNSRQDHTFTLPLKNVHFNQIHGISFTVSNKNEIICTFCILGELKKFYMYIITMNGELKRAVQVPATVTRYPCTNVVFNHVNETIMVSIKKYGEFSSDSNDDDNDRSTSINFRKHNHTTIYTFSNTGELLHQFNILGWYSRLLSHPDGPIALINWYGSRAFMLQM